MHSKDLLDGREISTWKYMITIGGEKYRTVKDVVPTETVEVTREAAPAPVPTVSSEKGRSVDQLLSLLGPK